MSLALMPATPESELQVTPHVSEVSPRLRAGEVIRRRGSIEQGRALEALGHAVEYLVDSRLFAAEHFDHRDEQEAVQILMRLSRAVFAECPEVISLRRRFGRWISEHLNGVRGLQQEP